jgi:hypothetical protein
LRAAALAAQTDFAAVCAEVLPAERTERADLIGQIEMRLQLDQARITAVTGMLPTLEAFYGSLTDEQKAQLQPRGFARRVGAPADDVPVEGAPADEQT